MISLDLNAITEHFVNEWDGCPIVYDNDVLENLAEGTTWARFTIVPGASFHAAGGAQNGILEQQGRAWLQVMVPAQAGDGPAYDEIERFNAIFLHARLDSGKVRFSTPQAGEGGTAMGDLVMYRTNVPWTSFRRYA